MVILYVYLYYFAHGFFIIQLKKILRQADKVGDTIQHVRVQRKRWYDDALYQDESTPPDDAPAWTISSSYNRDNRTREGGGGSGSGRQNEREVIAEAEVVVKSNEKVVAEADVFNEKVVAEVVVRMNEMLVAEAEVVNEKVVAEAVLLIKTKKKEVAEVVEIVDYQQKEVVRRKSQDGIKEREPVYHQLVIY